MSPQPPPVPYPPGSSRPPSKTGLLQSPVSPPIPQGTSLLSKVLQQRLVHSADQLFSVSDYEIITELHTAFGLIKHIFNDSRYADNANDQSVVELALSRITSAIRETSCIETYAPGLVDVLDACLGHKMFVINKHGHVKDSPHCRIASEILSSLFLFHSKKSVMTVAVPVAIKALNCGNQELVRSTTSYISLAAIHNGRLVGQYAVQIITNIINGNLPLVRIVAQLYPENKEPFHAHLTQLFRLLSLPSTDTSEKLSLLQLASMVANNKPALIIPHIGAFEAFLQSPQTCTAVLHIYLSLISMGHVNSLVNQLLPLKRAIRSSNPLQNNLATIGKVVGQIGRTSPNMAALAVPDLIELCHKASLQNLPVLLKEVEAVAEVYPTSVQHHLDLIKDLSERQGSTYSAYQRIRALSGDGKRKTNYPSSIEELHQSSNSNSRSRNTFIDSAESLQSKRSSRILPNDPTHSHPLHPTTMFPPADVVPPTAAACAADRTPRAAVANSNSQIDEMERQIRALNLRSTSSLSHSHSSQNPSRQATRDGDRDEHRYLELPSPHQLALLSTPIAIGKDGRVRPATLAKNRPLSSLLTETAGGFETTFPVANASPITTTASNSNINSAKLLPPRGSTKVSSSSLSGHSHAARRKEARLQSSETVGLSRTSSGREDFERGDVVKQFVGNRRSKIRKYVQELHTRYPIPLKCTVEGTKASKSKMRIHFVCQTREHPYCLHGGVNDNLFAFKTHIPAVWIHLMFLQSEVTSMESSNKVLDQESKEFQTLAHCWDCLPKDVTKNREFATLVTSAFPSIKEQSLMLKELQAARYFDSFSFTAQSKKWTCFSCAHPDKVKSFIKPDNTNMPLLEGQLKKRGKWRFLKRWHTKYFTLSSAALSYTDSTYNAIQTITDKMISPSIDLRKIKSVRSLGKGRNSRKSLPRAFEIFTEDDKSFVLKAADRTKAEEWFQVLQVAVAKAQRDKLKS